MVKDQYRKVWEEVSEGRLKVEERVFGKIVAQGLQGLEKIDVALFEAAWEAFTRSVHRASPTSSESLSVSPSASSRLVTTTLKTLHDAFEEETKATERAGEMVTGVAIAAAIMCRDVLDGTVGDISEQERKNVLDGLKDVLQVFEGVVWDDKEFSEVSSCH